MNIFRRFAQAVARLVSRLCRPSPPEPSDPYAYRMAPVRKGPPSRSGAVALIEPGEE